MNDLPLNKHLEVYYFRVMLQIKVLRETCLGTCLAGQWLGLHASIAGCMFSIPGRGTKILHAAWRGQKKKKGERNLSSC